MSNTENDTQLNGVAAVLALENLTPTADVVPAPLVPTEAGLEELEQLRADIVAFGDTALLARFDEMAKARAAFEAESAALTEQNIMLVSGHELAYIDALPDAMWSLWLKLSRAQRLAMTVRIKDQEGAGGFDGLSALLMQGMEGQSNANNPA